MLKAIRTFFISFAMALSHKVLPFFIVQRQRLIDPLRTIHPKLHCCLCIILRNAFPDFSNNSISLPQHVLHPPVERWLVINLLHHQVLRRLFRVELFQVSQPLPGCDVIFTDNTNLPASRRPFLARSSIHRYLFILQRHRPF